jgi:peptidoglycan/LPS O-acetylase OafA/YrhL
MLAGGNNAMLVQVINHGYLAVDFFYVLSGFVVGYAYNDRWGTMTLGGFFKRRLIRLHPLVIMGMIVGALTFYWQGGTDIFQQIHDVPVSKMLLIMLIGFTLIPVRPSMDIRGWQEMHPLNGPGWSLFFEYIANILYALIFRRLPNIVLGILVAIFGAALIHYAVTSSTGHMAGGWSFNRTQLYVGFTRMLYPFFSGLLLSRIYKPIRIKHAFWLCSLLIVVALALPRFGGDNPQHFWINGLYESLCIVILFPAIVYLGVSGEVDGKYTSKISKFLGDLSYPIYITHYPIIYIYTTWLIDNKIPMVKALPIAFLTLIICVVLAYASLKLYDEPIRKWLGKKWMKK